MADVIRQDDEIPADVQGLAGSEQHLREHWIQQRMSSTAVAVQQQYGVVRVTLCVGMRGAQRQIMQAQLRQGLAAAKAKIGDGKGPVLRWPCSGGAGDAGEAGEDQGGND